MADTLRKYAALIALLALFSDGFSQSGISVESNRSSYTVGDEIVVEYRSLKGINAVGVPEGSGFELSRPGWRYIIKSEDAQGEVTFVWRYHLRALKPGLLVIESPDFWMEGTLLKADKHFLFIHEKPLIVSAGDLRDLKLAEPETVGELPIRYVVTSSYGYVQRLFRGQWHFARKLSAAEVLEIQEKTSARRP